MKKIITVSIIGCGARGGIAYGEYINQLKDKYRIVSLCDVNPSRLNKFGAVSYTHLTLPTTLTV